MTSFDLITPDPTPGEPTPADPADNLHWRFPLHAFQKAGVTRLVESHAALLADEMGLGKTIQAIAALRILFARGEIQSALVVAPAGLILQWRKELRDWAPELRLATAIGQRDERIARWRSPAQVFLVGYEALLNDRLLPAPFGPGRRLWDVVVADEAQRIKNEETEGSVVLKSLLRRRTWALTGTPLENALDDVASIIDFVAPGRLDRREMMFGLRRVLGEVQLRRRRLEALPDLPPKTGVLVRLALCPEQRAAYDRAEAEGRIWLRSLGRDVAISHVLELIMRLKQICNACPKTDRSVKRDDILERLPILLGAGEKVLIFSQFVAGPFGTEMLARHLSSYQPLMVSGGQSAGQRSHALSMFQRDESRRVMILSLRAGGVGLNLTAASTVFHFDRWWNPAVEAQAEDRTHRIGQIKPVKTFAYLCQGTVEARIRDIIAEKKALFTETVEFASIQSLKRLDLKALLSAVGL